MSKTIEKLCQTCKTPFLAKQTEINRGGGKFCSRRCSTQYIRSCRKPKVPLQHNTVCAYCQVTFYRRDSSKQSKSNLFFCCRAHKDLSQRIGGIKLIQPPHYGAAKDGNSTLYRKIAFSHYEPKCMNCGYNKYSEVLQVHHKDRNRRNNDISNLSILCPTCHQEEHFLTNTGFWKNAIL